MSITQTVEVTDNRRQFTVPREIPSGQVIITFTSASTNTGIEPQKRTGYGCLKGQVWMADDFDAPLDDFKDYM